MTTYTAWMTDAETGNEGIYPFDGPDDLLAQPAIQIVQHFMAYVDRDLLPAEHVDYEINAALKHGERGIVTAMGTLLVETGHGIPFTLFIAGES